MLFLNKMFIEKRSKEIKEEFCGTCLAVPLAAGASTIASSTGNSFSYRTSKLITLIITLFITIVSLCVGCYYTYFSNCSSCKV